MTLSISITGLFLFHVTFKPFINQGKFRTPEKRLSSLDKNPSAIKKQSGKLVRKPSGGERAWFLEEESEPRNKRIFLAGKNPRADESAYLTVASSRF